MLKIIITDDQEYFNPCCKCPTKEDCNPDLEQQCARLGVFSGQMSVLAKGKTIVWTKWIDSIGKAYITYMAMYSDTSDSKTLSEFIIGKLEGTIK